MQKWEYCQIHFWEGSPSLTYFTAAGAQVTNFDSEKKRARIFAQLGEEGWEMCGFASPSGSYSNIYFKRPKP